MTLRASSVKKTAINLFLSTVKKNFGIIILVTIFMLLVCPGYLLVDINNHFEYIEEPYELSYMFEGLNYALTFLTCAITGIGCLINFNFVYSKKSGDLYFALPTTRNGLLFSRLGASIVPAVIPLVLCYGSMAVSLLSKNIIGSISQIVTAALLNLMLIVMTACIAVLFIVCAGSMVDLLISLFGINIGLIGVTAIFIEFCSEYLRGFDSNNSIELVYSSSPFLYAFAKLEGLYKSNEGFIYNTTFWIYVARIIALSVICLVAAVFLFKKRKAEKCTSAYAYKGVYYACSFLFSIAAAFLCGFIFSNDVERIFFWIFAIFGAVLGAVTFGLITDRGFKRLRSSIVVGLSSYLLLVITTIILSSGGLGYSSYIPKAENIETVCVDYDYKNSGIEYSNPQFALALHKKLIESEEFTEVEIADTNGIVYGDKEIITGADEATSVSYRETHTTIVRISYNLKNGFKVYRHYWVKTKDCADELMAVIKSEENITAIKKLGNDFIDANIYGDIDETENSYFDTKLTREECKKIMDTYTEELLQANDNILYGQDKNVYIEGTVVGQEYKNIEINLTDDFVNTLNLLRELDLMNRER